MGNPFAIDRTFVVSVKALRGILKEISAGKERWWIEENRPRGVVIGYNAGTEELNSIQFEFLKIVDVPLFPDGDGQIVCLYPASRGSIQRGLYWQANRLVFDEVKDWGAFWPPIREALARRYSEGSSSSATAAMSPPSLSSM
jgi:hypothetical protein